MKVSEDFPVIESITSESEKGGNPRKELSILFCEKDVLQEKIHTKVQEILQSEYAGASDEVKQSILRINERL